MLVYTLNRLTQVLEMERNTVIFKQLGQTGKQGASLLDRRSVPRQALHFSTAVYSLSQTGDITGCAGYLINV